MEGFTGEIRLFAGSYAPKYWALCNGQLLALNQNAALFSLIGTYYGGDGRTTFALPNLQGRVAIGQGQGTGLQNYPIGTLGAGGVTTVTLNSTQMPAHTHGLTANSSVAASLTASGSVLAHSVISEGRGQASTNGLMYSTAPVQPTAMSAASLLASGGNAAHNNMQPYVALNYCICLSGVFPQRP